MDLDFLVFVRRIDAGGGGGKGERMKVCGGGGIKEGMGDGGKKKVGCL